MKINKKICAILLTGFLLLAGYTGGGNPSSGEGLQPSALTPGEPGADVVVYKKREQGYSCFRIPAIIKTKAGALLAFAEGRRYDCGDNGEIDLVVKRSSDEGRTWSDLQVIWHDTGNTCGNPAPVVDQNNGKIHLLMTWNWGEDGYGSIKRGTSADTRRVYVTSSSDDGVTWATPGEITTAVKKPEWGWYGTGPCHGIQLEKGGHAGRLLIPCYDVELSNKGGRSHAHLIYSDDGGATWVRGGVTPTHATLNPEECAVAELSDSRLLLNCRCSKNNNLRVISRSADGGLTLSSIETAAGLIDPACQGSILSADVNGTHTVFFSNPANATRTNMTLKMSTDDGATWPKKYTVYKGPSAYSDIVMVSEAQVGILFEKGASSPYETITFKVVNVVDFD
jgi:sialidase-1